MLRQRELAQFGPLLLLGGQERPGLRLVRGCISQLLALGQVEFIRQPLPADAGEVPQTVLVEVSRQATISDQFLRADYEAIHHTPLAQQSTTDLDPIRYLIDASPITYHAASDAGRYPLVQQLILRHADQLYPKLVSGIV